MSYGRNPSSERSTMLAYMYMGSSGYVSVTSTVGLNQPSNGKELSPPLSRLSKGSVGGGGGGILSTLHYNLYDNDLLHLLEFLKAGMSIGHIDCSCPTCADDVALLAKLFLCLQLLLIVVKFFICREHYFINAQKSAEVDLNKVARHCDNQMPSLGADKIQKSDSEVHLGVDRNLAGTVDISARVQMGQELCKL